MLLSDRPHAPAVSTSTRTLALQPATKFANPRNLAGIILSQPSSLPKQSHRYFSSLRVQANKKVRSSAPLPETSLPPISTSSSSQTNRLQINKTRQSHRHYPPQHILGTPAVPRFTKDECCQPSNLSATQLAASGSIVDILNSPNNIITRTAPRLSRHPPIGDPLTLHQFLLSHKPRKGCRGDHKTIILLYSSK